MGRPVKELSEGMVYKLARINCSMEEMSLILGVSEDTLRRRFATAIDKGRAVMCQSLKRKQYQVAMADKGNVPMLIWLGKQHLGQSDKVETRQKPMERGDMPIPSEFKQSSAVQ